MKTFIYRIFLFFVAPAILFVLLTTVYYFSYKQLVLSDLKKISTFECLIMGDSQMQRIKPNLINDKTYNFASSGEHYYFTYQKIKKIIKFKEAKIKKIILGVSLSHFSPAYNRLFDLDFLEGQDSLERYLYFIDLKNNEFVKPIDIERKNVIYSIIKGIYNKPDWGGLEVSNFKNPDSTIINKILKIHYRIKNNESKISSEQIKYLVKIRNICKENRIDLYLVSTPFHPMYIKKVDSIYFYTMRSTIKNLQNIKYMNYLNDQINPNLFSDAVHLNSEGADIYSKMISDSINIKLHNTLDEDN